MTRTTWGAVLGGVLIMSAVGAEAQSRGDGTWSSKVDQWVLDTGATGPTEFLVVLREQADIEAAAAMPSKEIKGTFVFHALQDVATRTQGPVLAALASLHVESRPFWIANMVWVRGDLAVVKAMAERDDVLRVSANPSVKLKTVPNDPEGAPSVPDAVEWGITKTGAPSVWALGYKGVGAVVAGQDTGYQWDHPALKSKYRGWNGSTATHDYNWHDSIHSGGGVCGANSTAPCDDDNHGTHTMGTMVGDDGGTNQIGMAPDAKWVGCRNMDQGNGTPATYAECFQWFVAPTTIAGTNPDPAKAPDVINNSWGCPPSEGCTDPLVLKTVVDNARAAGIVVVVSAGNSGSSCSTVSDPAAIYDSAFSVGATSSTDAIASFSSRGPVTIDGSGRMKPDVSAPGVSVRSSIPGGGYGTMSGTSMAGPHVAGHVALLLSAMPGWKGHVDSIENRITSSAVPRTSTQTCGGVPGSQIPNNTFGWGRIDALASVSMADVGIQITDAPDPVAAGGSLTYTVVASNAGPTTATGVVATVTLPAGAAFVSASAGCAHASGTVTCTFGSVAKGALPEKSIVVTATAGPTISTTGTITGTLYDPDTSNNQASVTTNVGDGALLTVQRTGSGSGSVTSVPAGIACGATCAAMFPLSTTVELTAAALAGSSFTGWSGEGCSGTGTCQVVMDQARNVSATFTLCVAPAAPVLTAPATAPSGSDYQVSWTATSPIGSYELQEATDAAFTSPVTIAVSGTSQTRNHTASPAASYYTRARALDTCGTGTVASSWSNTGTTVVREPGASTAFYTLPPCRAFDTREVAGPVAAAPALQPGARRDFVLVGRCGIPSTASAVSANLTVVPSADGELRVVPGNQTPTVASAISFRAGRVMANNAVLFLATNGTGTVGVQNDADGTVDFILDVNGYFE